VILNKIFSCLTVTLLAACGVARGALEYVDVVWGYNRLTGTLTEALLHTLLELGLGLAGYPPNVKRPEMLGCESGDQTFA
jgi:hypothetical protein